ncbi:hypothetical protein V494_03515, partial [Pseudogymnoascus sp. VKM F-4513 (FW-928)]
LWSRLIVHFWAAEIERAANEGEEPTPVEYLQRAYEQTLEATTQPTEWQGTTTATGAQLHFENTDADGAKQPVLYVTNLGDSQVLVLRPRNSKVIFKTEAQWHWFDCPRQLGTNSPDTPRGEAVVNKVAVEVGDVVLAVSDGVTDNLWEHEVVSCVVGGMKEWEEGEKAKAGAGAGAGEMQFVADKLMNAARVIAQDPFAESPFMEHAIEEGLAMEGGKLDDISVRERKEVDKMRGKRSKQYKKLMQQYGLAFGFREPYQVLLDADIIRDADKFKMDLIGGLERTLHGQVKPMITQCSMRHLYNAAKEPGVSFLIDKAKLFERRRCGHLPADYPEPLSAESCISSVVDAKGSGRNKHCYVVASQDVEVRRKMRAVVGVPLVYINRSVMIMEPMADATESQRDREEKGKFRDGLRGGRASGSVGMKRKREDGEEGAGGEEKRKKKVYGQPKGPNPLSVKKAKKEGEGAVVRKVREPREKSEKKEEGPKAGDGEAAEGEVKKKTRRKRKAGAGAGAGAGEGEGGVPVAAPAEAADAGEGVEA